MKYKVICIFIFVLICGSCCCFASDQFLSLEMFNSYFVSIGVDPIGENTYISYKQEMFQQMNDTCLSIDEDSFCKGLNISDYFMIQRTNYFYLIPKSIVFINNDGVRLSVEGEISYEDDKFIVRYEYLNHFHDDLTKNAINNMVNRGCFFKSIYLSSGEYTLSDFNISMLQRKFADIDRVLTFSIDVDDFEKFKIIEKFIDKPNFDNDKLPNDLNPYSIIVKQSDIDFLYTSPVRFRDIDNTDKMSLQSFIPVNDSRNVYKYQYVDDEWLKVDTFQFGINLINYDATDMSFSDLIYSSHYIYDLNGNCINSADEGLYTPVSDTVSYAVPMHSSIILTNSSDMYKKIDLILENDSLISIASCTVWYQEDVESCDFVHGSGLHELWVAPQTSVVLCMNNGVGHVYYSFDSGIHFDTGDVVTSKDVGDLPYHNGEPNPDWSARFNRTFGDMEYSNLVDRSKDAILETFRSVPHVLSLLDVFYKCLPVQVNAIIGIAMTFSLVLLIFGRN